MLTSAADSADLRPVGDDRHQVRGKLAVHAHAELCLGVGKTPMPVQQKLLVVDKPVLVTGEHALQCEVR